MKLPKFIERIKKMDVWDWLEVSQIALIVSICLLALAEIRLIVIIILKHLYLHGL